MNDERAKKVLVTLVLVALFALIMVIVGACSTNHYFSINAEEMTNPRIEYHDSTNVQNPF